MRKRTWSCFIFSLAGSGFMESRAKIPKFVLLFSPVRIDR